MAFSVLQRLKLIGFSYATSFKTKISALFSSKKCFFKKNVQEDGLVFTFKLFTKNQLLPFVDEDDC